MIAATMTMIHITWWSRYHGREQLRAEGEKKELEQHFQSVLSGSLILWNVSVFHSLNKCRNPGTALNAGGQQMHRRRSELHG